MRRKLPAAREAGGPFPGSWPSWLRHRHAPCKSSVGSSSPQFLLTGACFLLHLFRFLLLLPFLARAFFLINCSPYENSYISTFWGHHLEAGPGLYCQTSFSGSIPHASKPNTPEGLRVWEIIVKEQQGSQGPRKAGRGPFASFAYDLGTD